MYPNKLGPLGFIALDSVLESPEDIVNIKVGRFVPNSPVSTHQAPRYIPATIADLISFLDAEEQ